ncbi:U6 snRNA-associated Sm-like protein LSm4 [Kwoniella mangroviensis CBS 10435]|uniref:LSM complex subunit LSM4 n=1 Tax=Kwoniella mangroviensis CBS 10435 TaxID=1331196 RepID=A0A1B9IM84_9TREE|nr:U6 snRNA-associated Sm-like protein LSm4 [Kwoniella mangroviensis CBS 10435]
MSLIQLPLSLLTAAQGKPMLVELKNGVTFNGHLVECDNFMNVTLREVYQTSADGERFWKMKEMFIKGNIIKYFRIGDSILDTAMEEQEKQRAANRQRGNNRGGRGGQTNNRGGRGGQPGRGGPPGRGGGPGGGRGGPGGRGGRGGGGGRGGRGGGNQ